MKIAYFCDEYPPRPHGGIGIFVKTIAEDLAARGHQITVVEFGDVIGTRTLRGVRIVTLRQSHRRKVAWLINRLRLRQWFVSESRKNAIDVFEVPDYRGWFPFPVSNAFAKITVRLHLSATIIHQFASEPRYVRDFFCEYLTLFFHRRWIGVSGYINKLTEETFGLKPSVPTVIFNPITVDFQAGETIESTPPLQSPYVLFLGSMTERKGVLVLAKAAKDLIARGTPIHFAFAGADTEYQGRPISHEVQNIVDDAEHVTFVGRLTHREAMWWMKHSLVVALPSKLESFGLVVVEAMALGVPVIYTRTGPGPEIVKSGVDGILVDPDDYEAIASHILSLSQNERYASIIGNAGRDSVTRTFEKDHVMNQNIQYYLTLANDTNL